MREPKHARSRGEHSEAAEAARLVARDAGLEAVDASRAGVAEADLLLRRDGHVEQQLRGDDDCERQRCGWSEEAIGQVPQTKGFQGGGGVRMFGVTE